MQSETFIRIALAISLLMATGISGTYRRRAAASGETINSAQQEGRRILFLRGIFALGGWGSILLYLIYPAWMSWAQVDLPLWLRWMGVAMVIACVPLVYWIFSSLGSNVTSTVYIRRQHSLVRQGPYRYIRHPLYAVGSAAFLGVSLAAANVFIFAMLVGIFLVLDRRADLEEARLIERFGQGYVDYMKVTGRYLP